jgi:hypothetical protein
MNRNRYANVDPYLNNRIRLKVPEGYSDYINASPIVLRNTKSDTVTNFIATQVCPQSSLKGPLHAPRKWTNALTFPIGPQSRNNLAHLAHAMARNSLTLGHNNAHADARIRA